MLACGGRVFVDANARPPSARLMGRLDLPRSRRDPAAIDHGSRTVSEARTSTIAGLFRGQVEDAAHDGGVRGLGTRRLRTSL